MKIFRVFRLVRVARLMRARGGRLIGRGLLRNRAGSALLSLLLMGILVLEFGSLWMLALEQSAPGANITTASDSIWYVVVTISTVGYGDQYPVTNEGRIAGRRRSSSIGVGIFGTFTGYLANLFLAPKRPRRPAERRPQGAAAAEAAEVADDSRERVEHLRVPARAAAGGHRGARRPPDPGASAADVLSRAQGQGSGRLAARPPRPAAARCGTLFALRRESMLSSTSATQTMPKPTHSRRSRARRARPRRRAAAAPG